MNGVRLTYLKRASIVLAATMAIAFSGCVNTSSASYQDGYHAGVAHADPLDTSTPRDHCALIRNLDTGLSNDGIPKGDNVGEWMAGCESGVQTQGTGSTGGT